MRRPSALTPDTGWCHELIGFPSTTFGLTSMPILHSSGIRLINVRSHPKRKRREGQITDIGSRLFDHLVGEYEQVMRNSEAECMGGLEVDNEIEFGRLLDRDIGRLGPA
jgi:hypothetical protein